MKYFNYEPNKEKAINHWNSNQNKLCDIVLSLTDNAIIYGGKIYALFLRKEIQNLMQFFTFNFDEVKSILGICGSYIKSKDGMFSINFNPERNVKALTLDINTMKQNAKKIYNSLLKELYDLAQSVNL